MIKDKLRNSLFLLLLTTLTNRQFEKFAYAEEAPKHAFFIRQGGTSIAVGITGNSSLITQHLPLVLWGTIDVTLKAAREQTIIEHADSFLGTKYGFGASWLSEIPGNNDLLVPIAETTGWIDHKSGGSFQIRHVALKNSDTLAISPGVTVVELRNFSAPQRSTIWQAILQSPSIPSGDHPLKADVIEHSMTPAFPSYSINQQFYQDYTGKGIWFPHAKLSTAGLDLGPEESHPEIQELSLDRARSFTGKHEDLNRYILMIDHVPANQLPSPYRGPDEFLEK